MEFNASSVPNSFYGITEPESPTQDRKEELNKRIAEAAEAKRAFLIDDS